MRRLPISTKKTWLIFIIIFFFISKSYSQLDVGPFKRINVPVTASDSLAPGYIYLPSDYTSSSTNYPVIIYYHGYGEAYQGVPEAQRAVSMVLSEGLPKLILGGTPTNTTPQLPEHILNPIDNHYYSFIVLVLQNQTISTSPAWSPYMINYLKNNYRVDASRIYASGISTGGFASYASVTNSKIPTTSIAAVASLTPSAIETFGGAVQYSPSLLGTNKVPTLFLDGQNDNDFGPYTTQFYSDASTYYTSYKFIQPGVGHGYWREYYDSAKHFPNVFPADKQNLYPGGMNVYQFLLANTLATANGPLPVRFTDFKVTDLGNKTIKVDFTYEDAEGIENFYIQITINNVSRDILITPQDKSGTNKYSKTINLNQ